MSESALRPPSGVKCQDCGCCQATIYAGKDPVCWDCDAGELCPIRKRTLPTPVHCLPELRKEFDHDEEPKPVKSKGRAAAITPEQIAEIERRPNESASALAARLGVPVHKVYYYRDKAEKRSRVQPVVIDEAQGGGQMLCLARSNARTPRRPPMLRPRPRH